MKALKRPDVGRRVVEIAWANGDRYYGKGPRLRVLVRAAVSRFWRGRRV